MCGEAFIAGWACPARALQDRVIQCNGENLGDPCEVRSASVCRLALVICYVAF